MEFGVVAGRPMAVFLLIDVCIDFTDGNI